MGVPTGLFKPRDKLTDRTAGEETSTEWCEKVCEEDYKKITGVTFATPVSPEI